MITPSGRFEPNKPLCFSMSDFHPETWNPSWTVSTIIMGVISFMNDNAKTSGSMVSCKNLKLKKILQDTTDEKKIELAKKSIKYNLDNPEFCQNFSDMVPILRQELEEAMQSEQ